MGLNLVNDAWIPAYAVEGARRIRAWEVADAGVEWADRRRGDLDLGCLSENETDWHARLPTATG